MLAVAILFQADPADQALQLFCVIRGDDDEDREAARYVLTRLEPSLAPTLRKMLPFQKDPVVKSAIREAIPQLYGAWGRQLLREGRIEPALPCFAEAAGATDLEKYIRAKVDDAKGFIRRWLPKRMNCFGEIEIDCSNCPGLVKSIWGSFGVWGLAAVLEGSRIEVWEFHYSQILRQMGYEPVVREMLAQEWRLAPAISESERLREEMRRLVESLRR